MIVRESITNRHGKILRELIIFYLIKQTIVSLHGWEVTDVLRAADRQYGLLSKGCCRSQNKCDEEHVSEVGK